MKAIEQNLKTMIVVIFIFTEWIEHRLFLLFHRDCYTMQCCVSEENQYTSVHSTHSILSTQPIQRWFCTHGLKSRWGMNLQCSPANIIRTTSPYSQTHTMKNPIKKAVLEIFCRDDCCRRSYLFFFPFIVRMVALHSCIWCLFWIFTLDVNVFV